MFDQLKQFKELASLLGQSGELKQKAQEMQEKLAQKTVEAESGAGAVRVTMNGQMRVVQLELDPVLIRTLTGEGADEDREMIQTLIVSAINAASDKVQETMREEMSQMMLGGLGGLNLPGMGDSEEK